MHELQRFLTIVISSKRILKEIYYTARVKSLKLDAKKLVITAITIQQLSEELLSLWRKKKTARDILQDRRAQLAIIGWTKSLPKRVKDYKEKSGKLKEDHLSRYFEVLSKYLDEIADGLTKWVEDIKGIEELPRIPKN